MNNFKNTLNKYSTLITLIAVFAAGWFSCLYGVIGYGARTIASAVTESEPEYSLKNKQGYFAKSENRWWQ